MQNLLKDFGFDKKFDGIPMHYFNKLWFKPFLNAAGQISVDGFTLKVAVMCNESLANPNVDAVCRSVCV